MYLCSWKLQYIHFYKQYILFLGVLFKFWCIKRSAGKKVRGLCVEISQADMSLPNSNKLTFNEGLRGKNTEGKWFRLNRWLLFCGVFIFFLLRCLWGIWRCLWIWKFILSSKVYVWKFHILAAWKDEGEANKTEQILLKRNQWDHGLLFNVSHQHTKMQKLSRYINMSEPTQVAVSSINGGASRVCSLNYYTLMFGLWK